MNSEDLEGLAGLFLVVVALLRAIAGLLDWYHQQDGRPVELAEP